MLESALGLFLPAVEIARDQMVELVHADRATFAARLALPRLGRAGVIAILRAITIACAQGHRAAALRAEADAVQQRRATGNPAHALT